MEKFNYSAAEMELAKNEPLPFESVSESGEALTWNDFDQDETQEGVFLY